MFHLRRRLFAPSLGSSFSKIWAASAISNVGDGAMLAAGPLLLISVTHDPTVIALATAVQYLPWMLLSLVSGALVDRADRRRLLVVVDIARGVVVGGLAVATVTHAATPVMICAVLFGLTFGETLADSGATALIPTVVATDQLAAANGRIGAVTALGNRLAGPPLGAAMFAAAAWAPFALDAVSFVASAALLTRIGTTATQRHERTRRLLPDIREGLSWLWHHDGLRALALVLAVMNLVFMSAFAIWPLFVRQELHAGPLGFGLLLAVSALGGIVGSLTVATLERRYSSVAIIRAGLVIETVTHGVLATARSSWVAGAIMFAFGIHAAAWGAVVLALRQRLVPNHLLGRVNSAYMFLTMAGASLGALAAGPLARTFGLRGPFIGACVAMTAVTLVAWRQLDPSAR